MLASATNKSTDQEADVLHPRGGTRSNAWLMWEIIALGAILRVLWLGRKSFWLDEIASVVIARMPGTSFWYWLWHEEGNMSLYYVLLRPWLHLGTGEGMVRFLSVIAGVACIPLMFLLARRLFDRSTGMLAALFFAVSSCAVVYSQEARGYSLLLLGTIASTYLLVRLVETPTTAIACAYALVAGATLYCHYFGLFVILSQAVSLFFLPADRTPWKYLLLAAALAGLIALPVAWMIHIQDPGHLNWVAPASLLELYHLGIFLAAEGSKGFGTVLLLLDLALVALFFKQLKTACAGDGSGLGRWRHGLVASCALVPVIASLGVSLVKPLFFHRFLIICLPAWVLMIAVGVQTIREHRRRMIAITAVCVLSLVSVVLSYTRVREDWRGVAYYLMAKAESQDRVLYYEPIGYFATESYRDWLPGGRLSRPVGVMVIPSSSDWEKKMAGASRAWLVSYPASTGDTTSRDLTAELQRHFTVASQQKFRSITITEYRLAR